MFNVPDPSTAQLKLVQYLNEAYGTEKRLETALQAHITMATRATYKKRLKDHLSETKRHAREVTKEIKRLGGGKPEPVELPGPDAVSGAAQALVAGTQKAVALAQGPLHALRGTSVEEMQLKNAKTEYASEAEEIATYTAIIKAAESLGEKETVKVAKAILREEQRMASFLEKEIPRMTDAVIKAEIPRGERTPARSSRRTGSTRRASSAGTKRATSSRGSAASGASRSSSNGAASRGTARGRTAAARRSS